MARLTAQWRGEAAPFASRPLRDVDYVSVWADDIHLKVRLEQDKVCLLVMMGVRGRPQGARRTHRRFPRIE